jgi:hypothetical protein
MAVRDLFRVGIAIWIFEAHGERSILAVCLRASLAQPLDQAWNHFRELRG